MREERDGALWEDVLEKEADAEETGRDRPEDAAYERDIVAERLEREMMREGGAENDAQDRYAEDRSVEAEDDFFYQPGDVEENWSPRRDFYEDRGGEAGRAGQAGAGESAGWTSGERARKVLTSDSGRRQDRPAGERAQKARRREADRQKARRREYDRREKELDRRERELEQREKEIRHGKKARKKHTGRRVLLVILLLVLAAAGYLFYSMRRMQTEGMSDADVAEYISEEVRESTESGAMRDYLNIAVLGVDSVEGSLDAGNNRSDVMVICSVNEKTGDIRLMSLYRDTYLDIGGGNYQKANAAYAYGGAEQTVAMMDRNLDLNISDYAVVGFEGIARIIDAVGGIEIDVQEDEIEHLNNYQITMSEETGMENIPVTQTGLQTLNGLQATAYCRIRYTEGNDFRRTERQRTVLTKTFEKIRSNPLYALRAFQTLTGYMKTSLSTQEILQLGLQAFRFHIADSSGFPSQDMLTVGYIGDQSCVIPITLSSNVTWLHSELFGESSYVPSQTVQDISAQISAVSGYY